MKKLLTVLFLIALAFPMATTCPSLAQESRAAVPMKSAQG